MEESTIITLVICSYLVLTGLIYSMMTTIAEVKSMREKVEFAFMSALWPVLVIIFFIAIACKIVMAIFGR